MRLQSTVEIGATRKEKVIFLSQRSERTDVFRRVFGIIALNTVKTCRLQLNNKLFQSIVAKLYLVDIKRSMQYLLGNHNKML